MSTTPQPLRPLKKVADALTWILGITLIALVLVALDSFGLLHGSADPSICVDTGNWVSAPGTVVPPLPLSHGVHAYANVTSLCLDTPSLAQQFASFGGKLPMLVFAVGGLFFLRRFLRAATEDGLYGGTVPGSLRTLGWYLITAGPACALVAALATFALRTSMVANIPALSWLDDWSSGIPWWPLVIGAAALTFSRILRVGVRMNEDLVGTI